MDADGQIYFDRAERIPAEDRERLAAAERELAEKRRQALLEALERETPGR